MTNPVAYATVCITYELSLESFSDKCWISETAWDTVVLAVRKTGILSALSTVAIIFPFPRDSGLHVLRLELWRCGSCLQNH